MVVRTGPQGAVRSRASRWAVGAAIALTAGSALLSTAVVAGTAGAAAAPTTVTVSHNKTWGTILTLRNGDTVYRLHRRPEEQEHLHRPVRHGVAAGPAGRRPEEPGRPRGERPRDDHPGRWGRQVTYKGVPLYLFDGDHRAGQVTGNIKDTWGQWWVVNPSHPRAAPTAATSSGRGSTTTTRRELGRGVLIHDDRRPDSRGRADPLPSPPPTAPDAPPQPARRRVAVPGRDAARTRAWLGVLAIGAAVAWLGVGRRARRCWGAGDLSRGARHAPRAARSGPACWSWSSPAHRGRTAVAGRAAAAVGPGPPRRRRLPRALRRGRGARSSPWSRPASPWRWTGTPSSSSSAGLPIVPQVAVGRGDPVGIDAMNWLAHVANHRSASLWRLHALHHSQEDMSVLTTFRTHPLVHATYLVALFPALILGASGTVPAVRPHRLRLPGHPPARQPALDASGPSGRVFVSPAYHRLHHASTPDRLRAAR